MNFPVATNKTGQPWREEIFPRDRNKIRTAKVIHNPQSQYEGPSKREKEDLPYHSKLVEKIIGTTDEAQPAESPKFESKEMHDMEKAMIDLMRKKFDDAMCFPTDMGFPNPQEITDALQMLNSNKELFIKLLHDPNSVLFKYVEKLRNADGKNVNNPSKVKGKLYGREVMADQGKISRNSAKIAVPKPDNNPTSENNVLARASSFPEEHYRPKKQDIKNLGSYFSVKEFISKLKSAADAKGERHNFPNGEILHRSSYPSHVSEDFEGAIGSHPDPTGLFTIRRSQSWKENKWVSQGVIVDELSSPRGSKYIENNNITYSRPSLLRRKSDTSEIKNEVSELLTAKDSTESSLHGSSRRTLGKLLSLPDYNFFAPKLCPPGDTSNDIQVSLSCDHHEVGHSSCFESDNSTEYKNSLREDSELKTPLIAKEPSPSFIRGIVVRSKIEDSMNDPMFDNSEQGLCNKGTKIPNSNADRGTEPAGAADKEFSEIRLSVLLIPEIKIQPVNPADSLLCSSPEQTKSVVTSIFVEDPTMLSCEKPQKPSPFSVLELPCSDIDDSPGICISPQKEDSVFNPQQLHFELMEDFESPDVFSRSRCDGSETLSTTKDTKLADCNLQLKETDIDYIRLLLEASNLTSMKSLLDERCDSWSQPLHHSLFPFICPPNEVSVDQLLLFDCVNEALTEISEQYLTYTTLMPSTRHCLRPLMVKSRLIDQVWENVNSQLPLGSKTLDQYIERDLATDGKWIELTMEIGSITELFELSLLEELIQDTVMEVAR